MGGRRERHADTSDRGGGREGTVTKRDVTLCHLLSQESAQKSESVRPVYLDPGQYRPVRISGFDWPPESKGIEDGELKPMIGCDGINSIDNPQLNGGKWLL